MPSRICPSLSLSLSAVARLFWVAWGGAGRRAGGRVCGRAVVGGVVCVCVRAQRPVGLRVSVKLHLHVLEIVEDCRRLLHPLSGGSQHQPTKSLTVWC